MVKSRRGGYLVVSGLGRIVKYSYSIINGFCYSRCASAALLDLLRLAPSDEMSPDEEGG